MEKVKMQGLKQGVVIHEDQNTVCILIGFNDPSDNIKTGRLLQQYSLVKSFPPTEASKLGEDEKICGDCKHRWYSGGICYVTLFQGPLQVYKQWKAGNYDPIEKVPVYQEALKEDKLKANAIRWGAYGESVIMPVEKVKEWNECADDWTGYTHQWAKKPEFVGMLQASVDSIEEYLQAKSMGWHTFRVDTEENAKPMRGETWCLNYKSKDIKCTDCMLCNGSRRDILNVVHGQRKKRFTKLAS
jgi:hypothetical protein